MATVSVTFSAAIQLRLELPDSPYAWRWALLAGVGCMQIALGHAAHRRWPVLLGVIQLELCIGRLVVHLCNATTLAVGQVAIQA